MGRKAAVAILYVLCLGVTVGADAAILLKALSGVASNAGIKVLQRRTTRIRLSFAAYRSARNAGIVVTRNGIARWLARKDVQQLLQRADGQALESGLWSLGQITATDSSRPSGEAERDLMYIILHEYLKRIEPSTAVAVALEWQGRHVSQESTETRDTVVVSSARILGRLDQGRDSAFHSQRLHPWRREWALALAAEYPLMESCIHGIAVSQDPRALVQQWWEHRPSWLATPPPAVLCWMGEVSFDFGAGEAALGFLREAIDAGVDDRSYWVAKLALYASTTDGSGAISLLNAERELHPLGTALMHALSQRFVDAVTVLDRWNASSHDDRAQKTILAGRCELAMGMTTQALARAEAEIAVNEHSSGLKIFACEALLVRASSGETISRLADAGRALELALKARSSRREWGGDSVAAAVKAVVAANLAGEPDLAWSFTQPPPEGDATALEARDPRLRREAVLTAAITGRREAAFDLLPLISDPFVKAEAEAVLAEQNDPSVAERKWREAWEAAITDGDRLSSAMGLANIGAALPDLRDLEQHHAAKVREIRAVAEACSSRDQVAAMRARMHESPQLSLRLAEVLRDRGDLTEAADVLRAAGERWAHPRFMSMAAESYYRGGAPEKSRLAAASALRLGGPSWSGEAALRRLLLQIAADEGRWDIAAEEARSLVALDPNDQGSRWALAVCFVHRGQLSDAWLAMTANGAAIRPRHDEEAVIWAKLHARFAPPERYVSEALEVLSPWSNHEQVFGTVLLALTVGLSQRGIVPSEEDRATFLGAQDRYFKAFPDNNVFRSIPSGPPDNPLLPIVELVREHEARNRAGEPGLQKVRDGEWPLGMAAALTGRPYAEVNVLRAAGRVFSTLPSWMQDETETSARRGKVVLDTSAVRTLAILPGAAREFILSTFTGVISADPLYLDAVAGRDALATQSSASVRWDEEEQRLLARKQSDDEQEYLKDVSQRIVDIFERIERRPWLQTRRGDDSSDWAWLSGMDVAETEGLSFWCDDRVLRSLASDRGLVSFSTAAVLRARREDGTLSEALFDLSVAELYRDYQVDLGFLEASVRQAALTDAWQPKGVAHLLTRHTTWDNPEQVSSFVLEALSHVANTNPEWLRDWVASASIGLVRIAGSPDAATSNLQILLDRTLDCPWFRPDQLPFILVGLRESKSEELTMGDPLENVLRARYRHLVEKISPELAARFLLWLVGRCNEADKRIAARVILTAQL